MSTPKFTVGDDVSICCWGYPQLNGQIHTIAEVLDRDSAVKRVMIITGNRIPERLFVEWEKGFYYVLAGLYYEMESISGKNTGYLCDLMVESALRKHDKSSTQSFSELMSSLKVVSVGGDS